MDEAIPWIRPHRISTALRGVMIKFKDYAELEQLTLKGGLFVPNKPSTCVDWWLTDFFLY